MSNVAEKAELQWKKFPVLNDGFVCLVDCMGDDAAALQAARVSYGKDVRADNTPATDQGIAFEKRLQAEDRRLLRYMMRHRHTSPFEQCELKFLVRVPMDCWRQWIRHRTASVNEYSTRYTEAIDSMQITSPDQWRLQSQANKQGSSAYLQEWPTTCDGPDADTKYPPAGPYQLEGREDRSPGGYLSSREGLLHTVAEEVYRERLAMGVAREQARKDLPLSTYTEAYWKIDLHNLLHFLSLRMDSHAQLEIRQYAAVIGEQIVAKLFPETWQAFLDYRFNAVTLSAIDVSVVRDLMAREADGEISFPLVADAAVLAPHSSSWPDELVGDKYCREQQECLSKLRGLGIVE